MATERAYEPSAGDVVKGIIGDIQALVHDEIALARSEVTEIVREARESAPMLAGGGGALAAGGLLLTLASAEAVSAMLGQRRWLGYSIVGTALSGVGYAMLRSAGEQLQHAKLVPEQTLQTMQDNVDWLKDKTG